MAILKIYLATLAVMSIVAIVLFGIDKRRAVKESKFRIPEKTLHLVSLLGGWPGALIGQKLFRHKTIKLSFRVWLWAIIALHLLAAVAWGAFWLR